MSKLSFRARALDPSKQMPIYLAEELPDLPEYSAINRAVPQMPSGMEKEEESEHHLQRAICTGLIIPTPEVFTTDQDFYDLSYPPNYKMPRQMIHMQPLGLEQDVPDYDMDSGDEAWVNQQSRRLELTAYKFEQMMDRLEKSSGQMVVKLNEAKALLKQDDEVSIAVYDYWLNKRLKMQHPLILTVKTENRPGASSNNPYLAFRRRTEKMQTRKNRKNDETSYEKMLKLRRDLQRATTVLEMVKRREKTKREQLHLSIEIFEKRVQLRDFSGAVVSELSSTVKNSRLAFAPLFTNQYSHHSSSAGSTPTGALPGTAITGSVGSGILAPGLIAAGTTANSTAAGSSGHLYSSASQYLNSSSLAIDAINAGATSNRKEKRQYKKRKHKLPRDKQQQQQQQHLQQQQQQYLAGVGVIPASASGTAGVSLLSGHHHSHLHHLHRQSSSPAANESNIETEEEEFGMGGGHHSSHKQMGSESEEEAPFAFKRKQSCDYLRPMAHDGNWPWESKEDNGFGDAKYRFTLTSIKHPRPRCIGFARRRLGRGGRVILDRVATNLDDFWSQLDYTIFESGGDSNTNTSSVKQKIKKEPIKPASPPTVVDLPTHKVATPLATTTITIPTPPLPATIIKTESDEAKATMHTVQVLSQKSNRSDDDGIEADFDDDDDEDEEDAMSALRENPRISRDENYISELTLVCQRHRQRCKQRRLRQLQQQQQQQLEQNNEFATMKRRKFNHGADVVRNVVGSAAAESQEKEPLPRRLLHRLAQLIDRNSMSGISSFLLSEKVKREKLNGDDVSEEVVVDLVRQQQQQQQAQHRTNHRSNNSVLNNNNNNSSININKNVSISDKFNVIKNEEGEEENVNATSTLTPVSTAAAVENVAKTIKQELIECASGGASADDSNEPLSSIKKFSSAADATTTTTEILDDEDNVNLAQLSSLIRHTAIKKEPLNTSAPSVLKSVTTTNAYRSDDDEDTPLNQMADVIRLRNARNRTQQKQQQQQAFKREAAQKDAGTGSINVDIDDDITKGIGGIGGDDYDYMGSLSPTSSQRLDVCNELLSEIRRDWLHFRPKTPTDELSDSNDIKLSVDYTQPLVAWSTQTPIEVEMLRVPCAATPNGGDLKKTASLRNLWDAHSDDALFVSNSFKYAELEPDTQLLQAVYTPEVPRGSSKSPEGAAGNSNSGIDFNLSGDSLNDINLLGDGDETDENMLDNILQECQIDDIKTLNQATNFWNGILDGEAVDEVESAANLLDDCIEDKKTKESKRSTRAKGGKIRSGNLTLGSTSFNVTTSTSTSSSSIWVNALRDDIFFKKEQIQTERPEVVVKSEIPDGSTAVVVTPLQATTIPQTTTIMPIVTTTTPAQFIQPVGSCLPAQFIQPVGSNLPAQFESKLCKSTMQLAAAIQAHQSQLQLQQQQHHLQQQPQQQISEMAAVGDIITVTSSNVNAQQQQQLQQQSQSQSQQPQQSPQIMPQLLLHQQRQQQLQQRQQQLQQQLQNQQQLLQLQRDLVSAPLITQYIPTSSTTSSPTTMRQQQQPTLTPIGSTASGNHMIYTTTSSDGTVGGPQKIYIQKAPATVATSTAQLTAASPVPSSLSTNAVITLSNVKLDNDGTQTATVVGGGQQSAGNILTIDGSGSVTSSTMGSTPNVKIISTASGQQVAVHSIGGVQHVSAVGSGTHMSTAATPLIVTTAPRNSQQLTQQQLVHAQPTQQIVWRQIGATNVSGGTTGVLTTTTEAAAAMAAAGNKIVWASRPTQKRQLNGPEGADINKLLLNRKFSQRKILTQQPQQHQIQITKQHLQQLQQQQQMQQQHQQQQQQQQQQQDDDSNNVNVSNTSLHESSATATSAATTSLPQQLQKVQMQGGKVIKMSSFPLLVSEINMQQQSHHQQQQLQQKHNSAAIAANHNYSLQPTAAIITTQSSQQVGGNKIYLTTTSSSGGAGGMAGSTTTNYTIGTASELQAAAAAATQKLHYKDLQNSNLKVNFVSTTGSGTVGGMQQSNITMAQHHQQQQQQQTVVLNKAATSSVQQKLKRERILNIIGATSSVDATNASASTMATATENSKRVLCTSLLNVKPLQKNNAGQMQMQIGPGALAHAMLRGRIGNNQTIFTTNMRTMPISTSMGNATQLQVAAGGQVSIAAGQSTNATQQTMSTSTDASVGIATSTSIAISTSANDLKSIESVTSNNNNNNNAAHVIGSAVINNSNSNNNSNATTNNTVASTTINR